MAESVIGKQVETMRIDAFSGGMNTSVGGREIADNEATLIENMEFDDANNLVTRNGVGQILVGFVHGEKINSIHTFNTEAGFVGIIYTTGTGLGSITLAGVFTGMAVSAFPGRKYYWKSLNNVLIGVGAPPNTLVGDNNIRIVGPAPGVATYTVASPQGRYIEEWRSRLFIAPTAFPNRIQCSNLGTADVWNTGGLTNPVQGAIIDIAPGDGDVITGLFAFKERLFIFKRRKIYVLRTTAAPETDPSNWEVVEYSKNIGCIAQSTIREVFDDVVFLSEGGLASLAAAEITGDFESALVSQKLSEIQRIAKDIPETEIIGFTLHDKSQYWLSVSAAYSPTGNNVVFVLDHKQIKNGLLRWVEFTGLICPAAMDVYRVSQDQTMYIMAEHSAFPNRLLTYKPNLAPPSRTFSDNGAAINQRLRTKLYDFGYQNIRKLFMKWFLTLNIIKTQVSNFTVSYGIDSDLSVTGSYVFNPLTIVSGNSEKIIRCALKHGSQRKGVYIKFSFQHNTLNEGVSITNFGIEYATLSERRAETPGVTLV